MVLRGNQIDIIRAQAGLTVNDLAAASNCSPGTIQNARHGKEVSIMSAGRIANALNVPLEQLLVNDLEESARVGGA